jgi:phosphatidylinositol alpha-mannosyltransferase
VRIAIVTDYYYPQLGGITEHVHGQATQLAARGHEVTVITGRLLHTPAVVDGDERPHRDEPFEIIHMGIAVPMYGNNAQTLHTVPPLLWESLRILFRRRKFDVMHVHAPYNPSFATLAPLVMPKGTVGVGTYHSVFSGGPGLDALAPLMRWSFSRLHAHVVVSEACVGSLAPYFPSFEWRVIPNGIDEQHFTPEAEPFEELRADGKPVILFLGRFDPRNGLGTMLRAFEAVHREHSGNVRLCIVGDGPLRSYYQRQIDPAVAPDVVWAGRVDWSRPRYYASADVHCTPCNRASFGMVLLEAMSCGRPVVASRISGFQMLLSDGREGVLVAPPDDPAAFAAALGQLLAAPAELRRMGAAGRRTATARYAWSSVAAELEAYYLELRGEAPLPAPAPRLRGLHAQTQPHEATAPV